ncbi:hypothetical protein [Pedobacter cryophilus]|uniref:hypothetical protein n=1 Tax=Pedobacter cryophilus TaxID=2571271 RepID=UPI00145CBA13|nr:hypothetical protein [Pedobacter cryophilus]
MASKTYSKNHKNPKALKNHVAKIKKRGGVVRSQGSKIVYTFGKGKSNQLDMF